MFGQILEAIVTVVASYFVGPILGDAAGQLFGLATGIQKSFNWNELAMSAVDAVVGGAGSTGNPITDFAIHALENAAVQGIGLALGLQKSFNWAAVAAAGVSGGVEGQIGNLNISTDPVVNAVGNTLVHGMAGDIAYAASKTLIDGSDFGDNILKGLPDVLSQTVGSSMEAALAQSNTPEPADPSTDNIDGSLDPAIPQPSRGMAMFGNNVRYIDTPDEDIVGLQAQADPSSTQVMSGDGNSDINSFDDILNEYAPGVSPIQTQPTVQVFSLDDGGTVTVTGEHYDDEFGGILPDSAELWNGNWVVFADQPPQLPGQPLAVNIEPVPVSQLGYGPDPVSTLPSVMLPETQDQSDAPAQTPPHWMKDAEDFVSGATGYTGLATSSASWAMRGTKIVVGVSELTQFAADIQQSPTFNIVRGAGHSNQWALVHDLNSIREFD